LACVVIYITLIFITKPNHHNKKQGNQMPQYVLTYLGGDQPSSPEEGKQHMAKYMEWLSSLGDKAVSPMNPFKDTRTVNSDGTATAGSTTKMSGFTIIKAESMDVALSVAKSCPFLEIGGSLEVSELMQMPGK
jgi:hypothetical protein